MGKRLPFWFGYTIIYVHKNDGGELNTLLSFYRTFTRFLVIYIINYLNNNNNNLFNVDKRGEWSPNLPSQRLMLQTLDLKSSYK